MVPPEKRLNDLIAKVDVKAAAAALSAGQPPPPKGKLLRTFTEANADSEKNALSSAQLAGISVGPS